MVQPFFSLHAAQQRCKITPFLNLTCNLDERAWQQHFFVRPNLARHAAQKRQNTIGLLKTTIPFLEHDGAFQEICALSFGGQDVATYLTEGRHGLTKVLGIPKFWLTFKHPFGGTCQAIQCVLSCPSFFKILDARKVAQVAMRRVGRVFCALKILKRIHGGILRLPFLWYPWGNPSKKMKES